MRLISGIPIEKENLEERLNLSPGNQYLRYRSSILDSLIPNYDEYLWEISLFQTDCCHRSGKWSGIPSINQRQTLKHYILEKLPGLYRVEELTEEHIVSNDEEKLVVKVWAKEQNFDRSTSHFRIEVTMHRDRPEALEIKMQLQ